MVKRTANGCVSGEVVTKRKPGAVLRFSDVTTFYFPRSQGFCCVPSQGGSTLGMEFQHSHKQVSCIENISKLDNQQTHADPSMSFPAAVENGISTSCLTPSTPAGSMNPADLLTGSCANGSDIDTDDSLQPLTSRGRRALLRAAGVTSIDPAEKRDCYSIRRSRETCGCQCLGSCSPASCSCALSGIPCQSDRPRFPCACVAAKCHNPIGRTEFCAVRVKAHYLHTMIRLKAEQSTSESPSQEIADLNSTSHGTCVECQTTPAEESLVLRLAGESGQRIPYETDEEANGSMDASLNSTLDQSLESQESILPQLTNGSVLGSETNTDSSLASHVTAQNSLTNHSICLNSTELYPVHIVANKNLDKSNYSDVKNAISEMTKA